MHRYLKTTIGLIAMTLCAFKCSRAQESFLSLQMCVFDENGIDQLKSVMHTLAKSENLKFIDNSAATGQALKNIGADKAMSRDASLAVDLHIEGQGGLGVTAGNLGLPPYQIALGFTEGSEPGRAHKLAHHVVQALSKRWQVEQVAQGKGVFPMKTCGG